jgi:hypothetical protein
MNKSFLKLLLIFSFFLGCQSGEYVPDDLDIKLAGRARLKQSLNDPSSLEIIDEQLVKPGRQGASVGYQAKFRAKNGFGGYVVDSYYTE